VAFTTSVRKENDPRIVIYW